LWRNEDPIGKPIGVGHGGFGDRAEVVGIVGNVRYVGMEEAPKPDVYLSYRQSQRNYGTLFVRTAGDPVALKAPILREVAELNKNLPLHDIKSMRERIADSTARMRFNALLLAIFASIALVLAAVGIYGVMSYAVTQRTREIGIRMALGAEPGHVLGLVVRHGMLLAIAGIGLGAGAALALTRLLATLLYQVDPADPATYAVLGGVLSGVALIASYIPARRATQVDPLIALRES